VRVLSKPVKRPGRLLGSAGRPSRAIMKTKKRGDTFCMALALLLK
jgi:hypothetical protein